MSLLDLPPELIDEIITLSLPAGIEAFRLSCKTINERAANQIARHGHLTRRWKHATNATTTRRGDSLRILWEISRDPVAAEYIQTLCLWDNRPRNEVDDAEEGYDFRADAEEMAKVEAIINESEWLKQSRYLTDWWNKIMEADNEVEDGIPIDAILAAITLLSLLPNLRTLQLPWLWESLRTGGSKDSPLAMVDSLISWSNSQTDPNKPLKKLKTLLPMRAEGYDERLGLQTIHPFMILESIREVYGVSYVAVDDGYSGIAFNWQCPGGQTPITKVEFAYSCMDAECLAQFLSHAPALTVFKYSHQTKWHGCGHDWNPGEFIQTLATYCGSRLIELAITIDELFGAIINGASTLVAFTKLRKLEIDVLVFCGPPIESGQQLGLNAFIAEGVDPWTHGDIPCLGDMLPGSIEEVHINTDFPEPGEQALWPLFKNIHERRRSKVKQLHTLIIRQYNDDSAQVVAEASGVTLEVFGRVEGVLRQRAMMPAWKREFEATVGEIAFG